MSHTPRDRSALLTVDVAMVERLPAAARITLAGELDLAGLPLLRTILRELATDGVVFQVLDMEHVTFIDSAGIGALIGAHQRARRLGGALHLAAVAPTVRTVVTITGLHFVFRLHPDTKTALAAVEHEIEAIAAGEGAVGPVPEGEDPDQGASA